VAPLRIQIVDDSPDVRERLRMMIESHEGMVVVAEADSPAMAFEQFTRERPDAIILDMRLKNGSGLDVIHAVRETAQPVRILVWTNYPHERYRTVTTIMGADYFFWKATEYDRLIATLCDLVQADEERPPRPPAG
jgi:DNA-binding NarL/FixJ family response regulator